MRQPNFFTYILTNWELTVTYTGFTNNLQDRLLEHWIGKEKSFTTRYKAYYLVWYNPTKYVLNAIALEKEIKGWSRAKKDELIASMNPEWKFLNEEILGVWPPSAAQIADVLERRKRNG